MNAKADYVRSQGQTRKHHCHWPGCEKQVPPAMWGCSRHWFKLPRELQLRIWSSYRPGQEIDGKPSANYIADAKAVQAWIAQHDDQSWDRAAEQLTRRALGADVDRPINPHATSVDDL